MERTKAFFHSRVIPLFKNIWVKKAILLPVFMAISFFLASVYRPYIYANDIYDLGIADIGNNLVFVPGSWLLSSFFVPKKMKTYEDNRKWIIISFFLLAFVEIISSKFTIFGYYDFKDIIGLFIGTLIALKVNQYLESKKTVF